MALGVARIGIDTAGGTQLPFVNSTVRANGALIQVLGGPVAGHGDSPHNSPRMVTSSATVRINGIPVCRLSDKASCGHVSTGSADVRAG